MAKRRARKQRPVFYPASPPALADPGVVLRQAIEVVAGVACERGPVVARGGLQSTVILAVQCEDPEAAADLASQLMGMAQVYRRRPPEDVDGPTT